MAEMSLQERAQRAHEIMKLLAANKARTEATYGLFAAAVIASDPKEQQRIRDNLHALLDSLLDLCVEINVVTNV